jgi:DNA adenine methylase
LIVIIGLFPNNGYSYILKNTDIILGDVEGIFNKYNSKDNFMFLDPPYDSKFTNYGYYQYDQDNHIKLFNNFISTKNKCLLIIGSTPFINDLYKDYIKAKYHKKYAFKIYNNRVGKEIDNYHLIITNYE